VLIQLTSHAVGMSEVIGKHAPAKPNSESLALRKKEVKIKQLVKVEQRFRLDECVDSGNSSHVVGT
jgi:hypothetical protein